MYVHEPGLETRGDTAHARAHAAFLRHTVGACEGSTSGMTRRATDSEWQGSRRVDSTRPASRGQIGNPESIHTQ